MSVEIVENYGSDVRTLARESLQTGIYFSKGRALSIIRLKPVMESYHGVRSRDYYITYKRAICGHLADGQIKLFRCKNPMVAA